MIWQAHGAQGVENTVITLTEFQMNIAVWCMITSVCLILNLLTIFRSVWSYWTSKRLQCNVNVDDRSSHEWRFPRWEHNNTESNRSPNSVRWNTAGQHWTLAGPQGNQGSLSSLQNFNRSHMLHKMWRFSVSDSGQELLLCIPHKFMNWTACHWNWIIIVVCMRHKIHVSQCSLHYLCLHAMWEQWAHARSHCCHMATMHTKSICAHCCHMATSSNLHIRGRKILKSHLIYLTHLAK